ncbi:leukotriene B4 receptor 1-like [Xyrauchen texanus]|uniref:leukotriene B4 receptor 1-like n=1 Tax=Xyrauchen texanus TaxID=154827 RepID=UPI0022422299|nr:leukotriene B4 receptor 1-like [Xyrauchen texanus]
MQAINNTRSNATHWTPESKTSSAILGICMILGIPGNVAVIVVISTHMKKKSYTLRLMLNLAVSDIISLLTMPLWINNQLNGWNLSKGTCRLFIIVLYISIVSNILTVTLMSVQRYLQVLCPHRWARLGRRREKSLLVSLWALSFLIAGPYSTIYDVVEEGCEISLSSDAERLLVLGFETLLCFIVPFFTMAIFYFCLHKKVNQTAYFRNQRMTRVVTCILVVFFVLWIPYHILNLVEIAAIALKLSYQDTSKRLLDLVWRNRHIVEGFASFNTCVNPYLYAFSFKSLHQRAKQTKTDNDGTKCSTEI